MVKRNERRDGCRSRRLVGFFIYLLLLLTPSLYAEKPVGYTKEISLEKIFVGDRFVIRFLVDKTYSSFSDLEMPKIPEGLELENWPNPERSWDEEAFNREHSLDGFDSGDEMTSEEIEAAVAVKREAMKADSKIEIRLVLRAEKRGVFIIPAFNLSVDGENLTFTSTVVSVLNYDEKAFKYPVDAEWKVALPKVIYVGQALPLVLQLANSDKIIFPDGVWFEAPVGGLLEKVTIYNEDIEESLIEENPVYKIPLGSWYFIPSEEGIVTIPPASVRIDGMVRYTKEERIEVRPVQDILKESSAIGEFAIHSVLSGETSVIEGDTIILNILLRGVGNLNFLRLPTPRFEGLTLVSQSEENQFNPSPEGYSGLRKDVYRFQCTKPGIHKIVVPSFFWLDPKNGRVLSAVGESFEIDVRPIPKEDSVDDIPMVSETGIFFLGMGLSLYNPYLYLLLLPGILFLLFCLIQKKRLALSVGLISIVGFLAFSAAGVQSKVDDPRRSLIKAGLEAYENEQWNRAIDAFTELDKISPDNPAVYYNLGLIYFKKGDPSLSIYMLRKACFLKPGLSFTLKTLKKVEKSFKMDYQIPLPLTFYIDLYFYFFLLSANALLFFIGRAIKARRLSVAIWVFLLGIVLFISLLGVGYGEALRSKSYAVIDSSGAAMRRVPGEQASRWLTLPPGTAVMIQAKVDDSFLVKTGYGTEGWIDGDEISVISRKSNFLEK